jgi:hypothetical protein
MSHLKSRGVQIYIATFNYAYTIAFIFEKSRGYNARIYKDLPLNLANLGQVAIASTVAIN